MDNNKNIAKNTLFLYFRMLLIMLVSLYTSRVILKTLGVEDFGLYNIIGGIIILFSFFNSAVTSATQRFLSFELGRKKLDSFQKIINLSLLTYIALSLIIIFLSETIGLWFLNNKMTIPDNKLYEANWVFQLSILTFILGLLRTPYNAAIIAHERMSFYAFVSIIEVILKLLIVYLLIYLSSNKLIMYALLVACVVFLINIFYVVYCFTNFKECRFRYCWDYNTFKKLLSFSGWSMFGSLATVSSNQGVNIVMNLFYGVTINAAMGISHQVAQAVNQFITNFQIAFNPQITKSYASGNFSYLNSLTEHSAKLSFFIMMVLSIPLILGMDLILNIWLDTVPPYTSIFCKLTIISYLIDTLSAPLYMTVQATGKIKKYQMCVSSIFLLNIVLSYILFKIGLSPEYALYVKIFISITLLIYRIIFIHSALKLPIRNYILNTTIRPIIIFLSTLYLSSFIYTLNTNIYISIIKLVGIGILSILVVYVFGLSISEKNFITSIIKSKIKR